MLQSKDLIEIYKSKHGCVYQSDAQKCFWLDFSGNMAPYNVSSFFRLKSLVDKIDIGAMVNNATASLDFEIIGWCNAERCYVLTVCELVQLKSLLAGAKAMLELNTILHEMMIRSYEEA